VVPWPDDRRPPSASLLQRLTGNVATVHVQDVEDVKDDLTRWISAAVLQCLKRRPAFGIQGHDLPVEYHLVRPQISSRRGDSRVHARQVFVVPGPDLNAVASLNQQRSVAIEFQLIQPVFSLG